LDTRLLRAFVTTLLEMEFKTQDFDLAVYIVRAPEMSQLNEKFLQHSGSTDVITFDYSNNSQLSTLNSQPILHGEIFICIDDARAQARQFRVSWQSELARYIIHGLLHLRGFDDTTPALRRKMKREENRLLRKLARLFPLRKLAAAPKLAP
jgi:probable rRNA maturation factor